MIDSSGIFVRKGIIGSVIGAETDTSNISDEQLQVRMVNGDEEALAVIFDRYGPQAMGLVLRIVRSRPAAEEIVQETFCRVWDKCDTYKAGRGSFGGWLLRIARNGALDWLRRQKVRPQVAEGKGEMAALQSQRDRDANVAEAAWLSIKRDQVHEAMRELPDEQRQVLELAYFRGLTRREIANETGMALGTVHTRARLALQKLRLLLQSTELEG